MNKTVLEYAASSPQGDSLWRVFGLLSLIFAGTETVPFLLMLFIRLAGRRQSQLETRLSDFIFDYGFVFDVLAVLFIGLALTRRGEVRRLGIAAGVVLAIGWGLWSSGV